MKISCAILWYPVVKITLSLESVNYTRQHVNYDIGQVINNIVPVVKIFRISVSSFLVKEQGMGTNKFHIFKEHLF